MTATVTQWLSEERAQLGTTESPPQSNDQKYGAAFGENGVAWCAIYQWWCDHNLGITLPFFSASVVEMCELALQHGYWIPSTQAQPGDWIARSWQNLPLGAPGLDWSDTHMQAVLSVEGRTLDLIGGNQNDPSGGIVSLDTATAGESSIMGAIAFSRLFAAPHAGSTTTGTKPSDTKSPSHPNPMPMLYVGQVSNGQTVHFTKEVQSHACPNAVDGIYGPQTQQAVKDWQHGKGLVVDGVVGKLTYASMGITS